MKNIIYLFLILLIVSCNNKKEISAPERLLMAFPAFVGAIDTLHFYNLEHEGKSLTDSIVEEALPQILLEKIGFQIGDTKYGAVMKFALDENNIACVLNVNESWYKQQSLLVFNKTNNIFEKVINLSQFYGGDGGQVVTESWLYRKGNETYLYQMESSHAMVMVETSDEPEEFLSENTSLYKWSGDFFEPSEMRDSVALSKKFKLSWEW